MDRNNPRRAEKRWKPLVYICSPYSGDTEKNTANARRYSRFAVDHGAIPLAPHLLLPQYMSDETERDEAIFADMVLLGKCSELWVFGDNITDGMAAEIRKARYRKMTIRHFNENCEEEKHMNGPVAIQTEYKGYLFRSRLEARWAVFFDACGVDWEYEPEGFDLGNGMRYLPDFLLHGVQGRDGGDLYVEVKGQMSDADARKINRFVELGFSRPGSYGKSKTAILVVGRIPEGDTIEEITSYVSDVAYRSGTYGWPCEFNFETIDGDYYAAHPGINRDGGFELFGDDCNYLSDRDDLATERAYRKARQARFEYGETPTT